MPIVDEAILNIKGNNQLGPVLSQVQQQFNAVTNNMRTQLQQLQQQVSTFNQPIQQVNAQIATFTSQGTQVSNVLRQINSGFTAGVSPMNQQGNALANLNMHLKEASKGQTQLGNTLTSVGQKFGTVAIGVSSTANGVFQLSRSYRDLNDMQIQVDRATRRVSLAEEGLTKAREDLNKLTGQGVTSGQEYEQAILNVQQAEAQLAIQTQLVGERQEDLSDFQNNFYLSIIPTGIGAIGTLVTAFQGLGLNMEGLGKKFASAGLSLSDFGGKLGALGLTAGVAAATAVIANQINVLNNYRIANEQIAASIAKNDWEGVLTARLQGLKGEFDNVFGQAASTLRNALPEWMRSQDAEMREAEKIFLENREQFRNDFNEFTKSPEWIEVMKLNPKVRATIQTEINTLTSLLDPNNFDKNVTDPKTGKFSEWYAQTWLDAVKTSLGIIQEKLPSVLADAPKILDSLNRALVYQNQYMSDVTSQADEYAHGINESSAANIEMAKSGELSNRALEYQRQNIPQITSQADELAHGYSEVASQGLILNRALEYQRQNNPIIASQADEIAQGVNEQATQTTILNRALEYQQKNMPQITSQADEYASGVDLITKNLFEATDAFKGFFEGVEKSMDLKKQLEEFAKSSRIELFTVFDVKTPEERREKFLDKIRKFLPNKIEHKIETIFDVQAKDEGFKQAAANFIKGLEGEILANDTFANAIVKSIAKATPDTPEGKKFREWLNSIIEGPDTGKNLLSVIQGNVDTGEVTLEIPSTYVPTDDAKTNFLNDIGILKVPAELDLSDTMVDIDPNSLGDDVKKKLGIPTDGKTVAKVPVEGVITKVTYGGGPQFTPPDDSMGNKASGGGMWKDSAATTLLISGNKKKDGGGDSGAFGSLVIDAVKARTMVIKTFQEMVMRVNQQFAHLAQVWSVVNNSLGTNAKSGATQVISAMNTMGAAVQSLFNTLGKNWSAINNSFGKNAKSGANQIIDAMNNMAASLQSLFNTLAKNWSSTMNSMIKNARAGAQGVIKELNKIPKNITTTHTLVHKDSGSHKNQEGFFGVTSGEETHTYGEHGFPEAIRIKPLRGHSLKDDLGGDALGTGFGVAEKKSSLERSKSNFGGRFSGPCNVTVRLVTPDGRIISEISRPYVLSHYGATR